MKSINFPGYNILPGVDKAAYLAHQDRAPGGLHVVVNDPGFAIGLALRYPDSAVVPRSWPDDVIHSRGVSAGQWADVHMPIAEAAPNIWIPFGNESGWVDHAPWALQAAHACLQRNMRGVLFNLQVGNPEPHQISAAHDVLKLLCENPTRLALGIHEYHGGLASTGMGFSLLDYGPNRADWPKIDNPIERNVWHVGRLMRILRYCRDNFGKLPQVFITEFGVDGLDDIKAWQDTNCDNPSIKKGYRNWTRAWAKWWPGRAHGASAVEQERYLVENWYAPFNIRVATFVRNKGNEWDLYATQGDTAYEQAREVWYMETVLGAGPSVQKRVALKNQAQKPNVRLAPSTSAAITGTLSHGDVIHVFTRTLDNPVNANGYQWVQFDPDGAGPKQDRWIALTANITLEPVEPEPPAPTPTQITLERADVELLHAQINSLQTKVASWLNE